MKIIDCLDGHLDLPPERVSIKTRFQWPEDFVDQICFGVNQHGGAPLMAVKLAFLARGKKGYQIAFWSDPPAIPPKQLVVDVSSLFGYVDPGGRRDRLNEILDLAANHFYTPLAKVEISEEGDHLKVCLQIGNAWTDSQWIRTSDFKRNLGL